MQVKGMIQIDVEINPIEVLENLKREAIGDGFVTMIGKQFVMGYETGGSHSWTEYDNISGELYAYISSIDRVIQYIRKNLSSK